MHNSILQITNESKTCLGTGFVVDKDHKGIFVATCGHVVNDCGETILIEGKKPSILKNSYSEGLDLAILYVENIDKEPLPIIDDKSVQTVQVIGYSKLLNDPKRESITNIKIKTGIEITKKSDLKIDAIKLYPTEPISRGYSGSPVICQTSNKVIGVVNIEVGDNTNYAISSKHLLEIHKFPDITTVSTEAMKKGLFTKIDKESYIFLEKQFEKNIEKSLTSFSTQPKIWVEPKLHTKNEDSILHNGNDTKVNISDIIDTPKSFIIQARPQFGLTCLAHYFIKEAWIHETPSFWLYLDSNELKPHKNTIEKLVQKKIKSYGLSMEDIECVVLDQFSVNINEAEKVLDIVSDLYKELPIILMTTFVENPLLNEKIEFPRNRNFDKLHLWALPRHGVRIVVNKYNDSCYIGIENTVVEKVIADLEVLNIPRTPLNCLTILKISEFEFDDSPVNRTEMIRRVLFLLFNVDQIPRYKARPDLKDTEYILGYFCEKMLRENNYSFTREGFLKRLKAFCVDCEIDLDVDVIFDVLYANNIITMRGQFFCFKFNYWILYFAAHRMHHNSDFANFIFEDMHYISYPELIEFYTGIDRRRDDALKILINDISDTCNKVQKKCGLPSEFDIYELAQWNPSKDTIEQMHSEVADGVLNSKLPDTIKDQYADSSYNRARPLTQSIHTILEEYSLLRLLKSVQAGAKALRNSDYSAPIIRHELLEAILRSWEQITKVLIVMAPILAEKGHATVDGASFTLNADDFEGSTENKFNSIIQVLPTNVVGWYKDDLFSKKMKTLLYKHIDNEKNKLRRHELNLLIITKRPIGWDKYIESYIKYENKNSFYLYDIYTTLMAEYQFSFATRESLSQLKKLIKMTVAKHDYGVKKISLKAINRISDDILPERDVKI